MNYVPTHVRIHTIVWGEDTYSVKSKYAPGRTGLMLTQHSSTQYMRRPYFTQHSSTQYMRRPYFTQHSSTQYMRRPYFTQHSSTQYMRRPYFTQHSSTQYMRRPYFTQHSSTQYMRRPYFTQHSSTQYMRKPYFTQHSSTQYMRRPYFTQHSSTHYMRRPYFTQHSSTHYMRRPYFTAYLHYLLQARALLYVKKNGPLSKMDPNGPGKRELSEKKQQLIRKRVLEGSAQSVPDSGQLSYNNLLLHSFPAFLLGLDTYTYSTYIVPSSCALHVNKYNQTRCALEVLTEHVGL